MLTAKDFYTMRAQNIEARLPLGKAERQAWEKVKALWDRYLQTYSKADFQAHEEALTAWIVLFSFNNALWYQAMAYADMATEAWKREYAELCRQHEEAKAALQNW